MRFYKFLNESVEEVIRKLQTLGYKEFKKKSNNAVIFYTEAKNLKERINILKSIPGARYVTPQEIKGSTAGAAEMDGITIFHKPGGKAKADQTRIEKGIVGDLQKQIGDGIKVNEFFIVDAIKVEGTPKADIALIDESGAQVI
jgi:hypothetical protein